MDRHEYSTAGYQMGQMLAQQRIADALERIARALETLARIEPNRATSLERGERMREAS